MSYDETWFSGTLRPFYEYVVSRDWPNRFNFEEGNTLGFKACFKLLTFLVCIKRQSFQSESEWRCLKMTSNSLGYKLDERDRKYKELSLSSEYVSGIVLGSRAETNEGAVRSLLRGTPYANAVVSRSSLG